MGLADQWRQLWSQHRNAVLAGGGVLAVGGAVAIRRRGASSSSESSPAAQVGYPATYDTTPTDLGAGVGGGPDPWSQFTDQLTADRDWESTQFDALAGMVQGLAPRKRTPAPRPPKPRQLPKPRRPRNDPTRKELLQDRRRLRKKVDRLEDRLPNHRGDGPVLHGGRPLNPLKPKRRRRKGH